MNGGLQVAKVPTLKGGAGGSCVILADFPLPTLAETESGATSP